MTLNEAEKTLMSALRYLRLQYDGCECFKKSADILLFGIKVIRNERQRVLNAEFATRDYACIGNGIYVRTR
jgi:hypothetical protein